MAQDTETQDARLKELLEQEHLSFYELEDVAVLARNLMGPLLEEREALIDTAVKLGYLNLEFAQEQARQGSETYIWIDNLTVQLAASQAEVARLLPIVERVAKWANTSPGYGWGWPMDDAGVKAQQALATEASHEESRFDHSEGLPRWSQGLGPCVCIECQQKGASREEAEDATA